MTLPISLSFMIIIPEAFKETIKKFGGLDIVVNNAGLCNEKNWKYVVSVNMVSSEIRLHIQETKNHIFISCILCKMCLNECLIGRT